MDRLRGWQEVPAAQDPLPRMVASFLSHDQVSAKGQHVRGSSVFLGSGSRLALVGQGLGS